MNALASAVASDAACCASGTRRAECSAEVTARAGKSGMHWQKAVGAVGCGCRRAACGMAECECRLLQKKRNRIVQLLSKS